MSPLVFPAFLLAGLATGGAAVGASLAWEDAEGSFNDVVTLLDQTILPRLEKDAAGKTWYERTNGGMQQWLADALLLQTVIINYMENFADASSGLSEVIDFVRGSTAYFTAKEYLRIVDAGEGP